MFLQVFSNIFPETHSAHKRRVLLQILTYIIVLHTPSLEFVFLEAEYIKKIYSYNQ